MKKIGIYKITSPSNKIYVGQSIDIEQRWNLCYKNLNCKKQTKLYNSLKKYGPENHIFEVIEECLEESLNEKEIYWGNYYKVLEENGLNLRLGNSRGKVSQEVKDKLSKSLKGNGLGKIGPMNGKKHKKITKQKMSTSHLGKKDSEETKKKKSQIKLGHIKDNEWKKNLSKSASESFGRPILQKDLNGNIIKEWETGKKAATELGLSYMAINACCVQNEKHLPRKRDKLKIGKYVSLNYIWEYKK